jgi:hypothetical protein
LAAGEVPGFLEVQRLDEEARIPDSQDVIAACFHLTSPRVLVQRRKNDLEDLLVNLTSELRKFVVFFFSLILGIPRIFDLNEFNTLSAQRVEPLPLP